MGRCCFLSDTSSQRIYLGSLSGCMGTACRVYVTWVESVHSQSTRGSKVSRISPGLGTQRGCSTGQERHIPGAARRCSSASPTPDLLLDLNLPFSQLSRGSLHSRAWEAESCGVVSRPSRAEEVGSPSHGSPHCGRRRQTWSVRGLLSCDRHVRGATTQTDRQTDRHPVCFHSCEI